MFARRIAKDLQSLISVSVPFPIGLHTRGKDASVAVFPVRYSHDGSENATCISTPILQFERDQAINSTIVKQRRGSREGNQPACRLHGSVSPSLSVSSCFAASDMNIFAEARARDNREEANHLAALAASATVLLAARDRLCRARDETKNRIQSWRQCRCHRHLSSPARVVLVPLHALTRRPTILPNVELIMLRHVDDIALEYLFTSANVKKKCKPYVVLSNSILYSPRIPPKPDI